MPEDPLEVDTLPSDPREMALRLLGMTVSELKEIDNKVISGKQYVGGLKSDLNKIVSEVSTNLAPKIQNSSSNGQSQLPVTEVRPVETISHTETVLPVQDIPPISQINDDQLEFDFYRKVKPEDLEYQLKKLTSTVEDLVIKVDLLYNHLLKKSTRKINGTYST